MSNRTRNVYDPGATHREGNVLFQEADIALRYALTLKDVFRARGIEVFMTRDDAEDHAPVGQRADAAEEAECDLFISLHLNDVESDQANGLEVLYRRDQDEDLALRLRAALVAATGHAIRPRDNKRRPDLAVLKFAGPSALIELGFIGNDGDRETLLKPQVRRAMCEAIADVTAPATALVA
jgi:N-acetylmuramoyl-L-alanine amidase